MNDTWMKTRPVLPLLISMALPNVISMMVNSLYNIVDSLFVARISEDAMTALSLVFPVQNFVNAVAIGFGIGINAMIALHLGAGEQEKANQAATHGMLLSMLHGVVCMVLGIAVMPIFLRRFTADENLVTMGVTYATVVFAFAVVNMANLAFEKLFQAVGRMKTTMVALIAGCVCNLLLDPLMIFGGGPFPRMGIAGAALATGIGQVTSLLIYLAAYFYNKPSVQLTRKAAAAPKLDKRLYSIGIPAILNLALPSLLVTFLNGLLAAYAQSYVVVLGIYYKLQTFLYLPANGFVQGMRPLIGYNYGAKEHKRVGQLYRLDHRPERRDPGSRHGGLSDRLRPADAPVYRKPGDHCRRADCAAHHLHRVHRFGHFHHRFRCVGRLRQGHGIPGHLPVSVHPFHYAAGLYPVQGAGSGRRVARILDHRGAVCRGRLCGIPPGCAEKIRRPAPLL